MARGEEVSQRRESFVNAQNQKPGGSEVAGGKGGWGR